MARFKLTRAAKRDVIEIGRYTLERWGDDQCGRYLAQLYERFRLLSKDPISGRSCDEIRSGYWRFHEGRHVIFYKLGRNTVEIVRILHERMLSRRHL